MQNIQKRSLEIVYKNSDYQDICTRYGITSFHTMHIKFLLTEVFKTLHNMNPLFMEDMFVPKQVSFNLRNSNLLALPPANTVQYGTNSVFFRGALLWNTLPKEVTVCEKLI